MWGNMTEDAELQRRRDEAQSAESRYRRVKLLVRDPAIHTAARDLWHEAQQALEEYEGISISDVAADAPHREIIRYGHTTPAVHSRQSKPTDL